MHGKRLSILFSLLFLLVVSSLSVAALLSITSYCDVTLESCKKQDQALELLEEKYPLDIEVDYLYYFDTSDPKASMAHIAVECAAREELKDAYKLEVQNNLGDFSRDALKQYAANVGLDAVNFSFCLDTGMGAWAVVEQIAAADEDGVSQIPAVRFNMYLYVGTQTFTSLHDLVKEYLGLDGIEAEETAAVEGAEESLVGEAFAAEEVEEETVSEEVAAEGQEVLEEVEQPLFLRVLGKFWAWVTGLAQ
jgi:hypothetical protein